MDVIAPGQVLWPHSREDFLICREVCARDLFYSLHDNSLDRDERFSAVFALVEILFPNSFRWDCEEGPPWKPIQVVRS